MATTYQRPDGRWCGQIIIEKANGQKERKTVYGDTRRAVEQQISLLDAEQQKGITANDGKTTFATFANKWLEQNINIRPSTRRRYESLLRLHINPEIGPILLSRLHADHLAELYAKKSKRLAPRTILHIHRLIHKIMEVAIKRDLIVQNPARKVDKPEVEDPEIFPLTKEQAQAFLEEARKSPLYALFVLALTTGMRQGELLGLRWRDVDLKNGLISIKHTLDRHTLELGPVKSKQSRRTIALSHLALEALKEHKATQSKERRAAKEWNDLDYVFATSNGTAIRVENLVRRHYQPLLVKAEVPIRSFHNLRHTCATLLLIHKNTHPKIVSQLLGHSSIKVTIDLYSHLTPDSLGSVAQSMDSMFVEESSAPYKHRRLTVA